MKDNGIDEILKTLNKVPIDREELVHWTESIEITAKNMCNDMDGKINFRYDIAEGNIKFFLIDSKSRDCLVKSIEVHLPSIPYILQGFFTVLKYNLKNVKFEI